MGKYDVAVRLLGCVVVCASIACEGSKAAGVRAMLPLITPPVRAATPAGLNGNLKTQSPVGIAGKLLALDSGDLRSRFFSAGPTNIFRILEDVDALISDINRTRADAPCLAQEPIAYDLKPFGQTQTFYASCYRFDMPGPVQSSSTLLQFGKKDGAVYLYLASGVAHVAARITPAAGSTLTADDAGTPTGGYRVDAWIGVGYNNAAECGMRTGFDGCSYGVIELHTDESRGRFEMSVAGLGFGYCGAQLSSDGTSVYAVGSPDMGETCLATTELCVAASDVSSPAVCSAELKQFSAAPLGRTKTAGTTQTFGASEYPGSTANQITLNGTETDSLHFGPLKPTSGVSAID